MSGALRNLVGHPITPDYGYLSRVVHKEPAIAVHDRESCTASEPHEIFYMQLSDDGENIRKWSRSPFDGARKCRVALGSEVETGATSDTPNSTEGEI